MIVLLSAVALLIIGLEVTFAAWPRGGSNAPGPLERATMAAVIASALWLGSTWMLALLHWLTPTSLAIRAAVLTLLAIVLVLRRGPLQVARKIEMKREIDKRLVSVIALSAFPLLLWVGFILWRGVLIPPVSHDALSYHLPKAVLFARSEGFRYLAELEPRQRNIPVNYEMLLTELVLTQKSDVYTEWPSAAFYLLFILASGALAERWWGRGKLVPLLAVMVLVAGIPVLLLHSGAHKNDVMIAFFIVAAMVLAGRFWREGELGALLLVTMAIATAVGTKPQAAGVALFMAPFLFYRAVRALRLKQHILVLVVSVAAFLLLGGAVYLANVVHQRAIMGKGTDSSEIIGYGDWRNLWQAPYVLLAAPFSTDARYLHVPWEARPWFWRRYEIYFSHLGIPFSLCALAAPFVAFSMRKREGPSERWVLTIVAFGAFLLMLPVTFRPHGMYAISLPRYALFVVPIVFAWTVVPLVARLREGAAVVALVAAALSFLAYAASNAVNDRFAPLDFVLWAREHPGTRQIPFDSTRSTTKADERAGPFDKIAVDASYASWVYPAFGARLTRPVFFIPPGSGPPEIPNDAKWVAIDRSWGVIWAVPGLDDLSQADDLLANGSPSPDELRVREYLLRDPRFKLEYARWGANQLLFRRVQ